MHVQFSDAGVDVTRRARIQSEQMGHSSVGTVHLLLSLAEGHRRDLALKRIFASLDVSYDTVKARALLYCNADESHSSTTEYPYTSHAWQVLQAAQELARKYGAGLVRPVDLLLALVPANQREYDLDPSVAGVILLTLGFSFETVRSTIIEEARLHDVRMALVDAGFED